MVGAGIFVLTGIAAQYAGPSLFVSFLIGGAISMISAMMYAELSSRIPIYGSSFMYNYIIYGEIMAWIVGWLQMLRFALTGSAIARGMASYFNGLLTKLGVDLPLWMLGFEFRGK